MLDFVKIDKFIFLLYSQSIRNVSICFFEDVLSNDNLTFDPSQHNMSSIQLPACPLLRFTNVDNLRTFWHVPSGQPT